MPSSYLNDLRIELQADGENASTWGQKLNDALTQIGDALAYGTQDCFATDANATTTVADGAADPARAMYFKVTSTATLTATRTLTIAPNTISRVMFIENATTGSQSITISQGSGSTVTIATGKTAVVYLDGAGATAAVVDAMAKVDPGVTDTLAEVLVAGNATGGTDIAVGTGDDITFADNAKAVFGAGSDLQIYHDGTHSYVTDAGTGDLRVSANNLRLQNADNTANYIKGNNGSDVELFFNNSAKLATTSTGIDVTGDITLGDTNPTITFNDSSIANLSHTISSASDNLRIMADVNGVDAGSRVEIFDGTTEVARFEAGAVDITGTVTVDGSSAGRVTSAEFKNNLNAGGTEVAITLANQGGTSNADVNLVANRVGANFGSDFYIETSDGVDGTNRKRLNVGENGDISFYEDTGTTAKLFWDASAESLGIGTTSPDRLLHASGGSGSTIAGKFETASTSGSVIVFKDADTTTNDLQVRIGSDANDLVQYAGGSERLRIDSSGNVGIGTSSPAKKLSVKADGGGSQLGIDIHNEGTATGDDAVISFETQGSREFTMGLDRSATSFVIAESSTLGSNQRLVIDDSGNVGINRTSPIGLLHIQSDAGSNAQLYVQTGDTSTKSQLIFGDSGDSNTGGVQYDHSDDSLQFHVGNVGEKMRLDSSGNLLVGTTSATMATTSTETGTQIGDGTVNVSANNPVAQFNRITTDGAIVNFRKDGTTVGSIGADYTGTSAAGLFIGNGTNGLFFNGSADIIQPYSITGGENVDNTIDLGNSAKRFKDLYLSGGVVFGSTGGAVTSKTLDDYEEGTWTPTIAGSTSGDITGFTISGANYTKVGRVVSLNCYLSAVDISTSTISGEVRIQSLPFASANFTGVIVVTYCNWFTSDESDITVSGYTQGSEIRLLKGSSTSPLSSSDLNTGVTGGVIMLNVVYMTS